MSSATRSASPRALAQAASLRESRRSPRHASSACPSPCAGDETPARPVGNVGPGVTAFAVLLLRCDRSYRHPNSTNRDRNVINHSAEDERTRLSLTRQVTYGEQRRVRPDDHGAPGPERRRRNERIRRPFRMPTTCRSPAPQHLVFDETSGVADIRVRQSAGPISGEERTGGTPDSDASGSDVTNGDGAQRKRADGDRPVRRRRPVIGRGVRRLPRPEVVTASRPSRPRRRVAV